MRSFGKQTPARQEQVLDVNGEPAASYTSERRVVQTHFKDTLKGKYATLAEILMAERAKVVTMAAKNSSIVRRSGHSHQAVRRSEALGS